MSSRIFKVKHKETGKYWQGHGSKFSVAGKEFGSALIAARQIDITKIRTTIPGQQLKDLVVIEEVSKTSEVLQVIDTPEALEIMRAHDYVIDKYGFSFFCIWNKVVTLEKYKGAKYIILVKNDYEDFRERLKGLGFSSRHYSKIKNWLIVYDDEVAMRIKLIDGYDEFINLQDILNEVA